MDVGNRPTRASMEKLTLNDDDDDDDDNDTITCYGRTVWKQNSQYAVI